jgi:glycosyltransferase involved in cell wall biosynthesis
LCGGKTHEELIEEYANAHVVVVPSVEDQTGDRDGLPNVVLEAFACGRAVAASYVGALSSAITHRENGVLLPPGNVGALTATLESLARDQTFREQLGINARARAERDYDLRQCTAQFCSVLEATYA